MAHLVIGGTSGLGSCLAQELTRRKKRVHITGWTSDPRHPDLPEPEVRGDLRDEDTLNQTVDLCLRIRPRVVFVCAGETRFDFNSDMDDCERLIDVNTKPIIHLHTHLRGVLVDTVFVLFSSMLSMFPAPFQSCYGATKSLLSHYAISAQSEGDDSLRLCLLGGIDTSMARFVAPRDRSRFLMDPHTVARYILDHLRQRVIIPGIEYQIMYGIGTLLPIRLVGAMLYSVYKKMWLENSSIEVDVIGNGNVGTFLAHHLAKGNTRLRWFARHPENTPETVDGKPLAARAPTPLARYDRSPARLAVLAVPCTALDSMSSLLHPSTPVAIVSAGWRESRHHPILLEGGRPHICVGFPVMCRTERSGDKRGLRSVTPPFQAIQLTHRGRSRGVCEALAAALTRGGARARWVPDVERSIAGDTVMLTLLAQRLEESEWRPQKLTFKDSRWVSHHTRRITGSPSVLVHLLVIFFRLSPPLSRFFAQHYERLQDQSRHLYQRLRSEVPQIFVVTNSM